MNCTQKLDKKLLGAVHYGRAYFAYLYFSHIAADTAESVVRKYNKQCPQGPLIEKNCRVMLHTAVGSVKDNEGASQRTCPYC